MVQTEKSGTLGASQDQTLITLEGNGSRESHRGDGYKQSDVMYTLNTVEQHSVCYGLEPGAAQRMNPESRISEEICPTLRANMGDNQASVIAIENHPNDSRAKIREDGVVQTLSGRMGTGGE